MQLVIFRYKMVFLHLNPGDKCIHTQTNAIGALTWYTMGSIPFAHATLLTHSTETVIHCLFGLLSCCFSLSLLRQTENRETMSLPEAAGLA